MPVTFQAGMRLTASRLNSLPKGEVNRVNRGGAVTLTAALNSETGILRMDDVLMLPGRVYSIRAPRLRYSATTATDRGKWHLRINTAGVATTTSTPLVARSEGDHVDSLSIEGFRRPTVVETLSILLSIIKVAGTSAWTAMGADEGGIDLIVEDRGLSAPNVGVFP